MSVCESEMLECDNVLYCWLPLNTLKNAFLGHILWLIAAGVSCGQLGDPINGRVDTSAGTSFGDVARYSCDTGYTVNGAAETTCQANRHWSGSVPTCKSEIYILLECSTHPSCML